MTVSEIKALSARDDLERLVAVVKLIREYMDS